MQDGSNAWPESHPDTVTNEWEDKSPIIRFVIDSFGNHLAVCRFPKAGGIIRKHNHKFAHDTTLVHGSFIVTGDREGRSGEVLTAPDVVFFDARVDHSIKALTDNSYCIHSYAPGIDTSGSE